MLDNKESEKAVKLNETVIFNHPSQPVGVKLMG
jgi:hypothetical protein